MSKALSSTFYNYIFKLLLFISPLPFLSPTLLGSNGLCFVFCLFICLLSTPPRIWVFLHFVLGRCSVASSFSCLWVFLCFFVTCQSSLFVCQGRIWGSFFCIAWKVEITSRSKIISPPRWEPGNEHVSYIFQNKG